MNICYILYSPKLNRYYTGASHEGIEQRSVKHNAQFYGNTHFSAITNDWKVFLIIECADYLMLSELRGILKK